MSISLSLSLSLTPFTSSSSTTKSHQRVSLLRINKPTSFSPPKLTNLPKIRALHEKSDYLSPSPEKPKWENLLNTAASLYPLYVSVGGVVACLKPSAFAWFVKAGPASYTLSLGLIMLAMGLTLKFNDLIGLFRQRPLSVSL